MRVSITFIRTKGKDLLLYFNLYCWTKKTVNDAQVMEMILKEEFTGHSGESSDPKNSSSDSLQNIIVDFASIEVKGALQTVMKYKLHKITLLIMILSSIWL